MDLLVIFHPEVVGSEVLVAGVLVVVVQAEAGKMSLEFKVQRLKS